MILVNIHDIKAKLSHYVEMALGGEQVVICKRNQPVLELVPLASKRTAPRPVGGGPYVYDVPDSAFAPLGGDELAEWDRGSVYPEINAPQSRIAEHPEASNADVRPERKP